MSIEKNLITGLILSGGRGSRMGLVDKGLQVFRGQPMVQEVLTRLQPQVGGVMINANQHIADYESLGCPVWPDEIKDFAGPLAGLQAGLAHCETPYLVTAPCDSPLLPENLVSRLAEALYEHQADLAVACTGSAESKQTHPVFCLLKTECGPHLNDYLLKGGRKLASWYESLNVIEVFFEDESSFANINTLEELKTLSQASR